MPKVQSGEVTLADKGIYIAQLCAIESKASTLKRDDGSDSTGSFWIWKFKGYLEKDPKKKVAPVEIATGSTVSKKDSALKNLLLSAYPDFTLEDMKEFDTDEMIGKVWRIKVSIGQKPDGQDKNVILNIEASDINFDPFAGEEDDD